MGAYMAGNEVAPSKYVIRRNNQRRSQRILLAIPVIVSGKRGGTTSFSERAKTIVVNAHGALIQLHENVVLQQRLRVRNVATNEETTCTVTDINPGNYDVPEVGVEFLEPSPRFWRVSFPPADWNPHSPEVKRHAGDTKTKQPMAVER